MNKTSQPKEFSWWRSLFWPIHGFELKKFLPMLLMYSLIVFNYSLLKSVKDPLVITALHSGAEAIPFIKFWAILPMAIFFTFLFTRLSNRYNREKVFYVMMGIFLGFFVLFGFVLFPFHEHLHPHKLANWLQEHLPEGFKGLISIFRNWSFTLFYVMSELWGTTIMTVLFWGFANEVSSVKDAKRFYSILGVGANLATIAAGNFSIIASQGLSGMHILFGADPWRQSVAMSTSIVLFSGLATVALYYWMNRRVFKHCPEGFGSGSKPGEPVPKIKMSLRKNFTYLANSKYLLCIAVIVLMFNFALNLIEVVWKDQMKALLPNSNDYYAYNGQVTVWIGIVSTLMALFFTGNVIRKFGWTISALVTPVMLFITGILFFSFLLFKDTGLSSFAALFGATPLMLGVFFGAVQNVLSRACKFTFFDTTKEMSFIPLDPESKLKGKAAIDGVGSRLGKSGGSVSHQFLLVCFGTVSASTPFVACILCGVVVAWMIAVKTLGHLFAEKTKELDAATTLAVSNNQEAPLLPSQG